MNSYADLVNKILSLKQDIDSEYFSNPKIKRDLEEGIWYDFLLYDRLLRKYECQRHGAIYLGGHNGEMLLTLILLGFSKILVVEPHPELFMKLQMLAEKVNHLLENYDELVGIDQVTVIEVCQCAVSDINDQGSFYVTSRSELNSLLKPMEEVLNKQPLPSKLMIEKQIPVSVKTVDRLIEESNSNISEFNFLYMNIQGSELKALQGAKKLLPSIDSIYLEKNLIDFYENNPSSAEIDDYLADNNFDKVWAYIVDDYGLSYDFYVRKDK